jgi:hypothetical protein
VIWALGKAKRSQSGARVGVQEHGREQRDRASPEVITLNHVGHANDRVNCLVSKTGALSSTGEGEQIAFVAGCASLRTR